MDVCVVYCEWRQKGKMHDNQDKETSTMAYLLEGAEENSEKRQSRHTIQDKWMSTTVTFCAAIT